MLRFWMVLLALVLLPVAASAEDKPAAKDAAKDEPKAPPKDDAKTDAKTDTNIDEPVGPLKNFKDKVSYVIGLNLGNRMAQDQMEIDLDAFLKGVKDGLTGDNAKPLLTEEQIAKVIEAFEAEARKKAMVRQEEALAKRRALGEKNAKEGAAFLAENKKREGVKVTASGLQYEIIKTGTGKTPVKTDRVRAHYKGMLVDGKQFDSSYDRDKPAVFPLREVIDGWSEALTMMPVGSKWKLYVPSDLAYGPGGRRDGAIGPNAVLIFEVELLAIEE